MIFVKNKNDVAIDYIYEGLRRMWALSIDKNGEFVSFDYIINNSPKINDQIQIPFEDVYCPCSLQNKIVDDLVNEKYCTPDGKIHSLKKYPNENRIRVSVVLGPSPSISLNTFEKKYPNIKNLEKEKD